MTQFPEVEWVTSLYPAYCDWHGFCHAIGNILGYSKEAFLDGCYLYYNRKSYCWIQQESTFWRRSLWQKSGMNLNTDLKLASDFELWTRFFDHADLYGVRAPLGVFRSQFEQRSEKIAEYAHESEICLCTMREKNQWHENLLRSAIIRLQLNTIPKLRTWSTAALGYTGRRISRIDTKFPNAKWQIKEYKFI
jgi:hypothetical protein